MNPQSITVPATLEALPTVLDFITQILDTNACAPAAQAVIEIAAEEIFVNIAHYAYPDAVKPASAPAAAANAFPLPLNPVTDNSPSTLVPAPGQATITCTLTPSPPAITIRFTDVGVPYNPLAKPDPDITLDSEARQIGGLGIYMVKNSMDDIQYEYHNNQNILTIKKYLT